MGYSQAVRHQTLTLAFSLVRIQLPQPTKKELLSTKSSFFVYPSRRLGISSPREAWCISSRARCALVYHHAPACICLRLDEIQHFVLMICNSSGIDDIHAFGVIEARGCEKLLNYLTKYDIIPSKGVIVWLKTIY